MLLFLPAAPSPAQGTGAPAEADAFLLRAATALAAGDTETSRSLVSSALELAPDYSEALYARAVAGMTDRAATNAAIADLRAALASQTWSRTDPAEAERALGALLLRTGRAADARVLAERCYVAHPEDPRNLLLLVRVEEAVRDTAGERKSLDEAAARFPDNDDLRLISSRFQLSQGRRAAAVDVISVGLRVHPDSLPLLLASARLERSAARRVAIVDQYAARGGRDPEAPLIALEGAPAADRRKYLDAFLANGGLSRQDLVGRAAAATKGDLQGTLQAALSSFSGARDLDADADGYWEERWTFDNGAVASWTREPREDGVVQLDARFAGGRPVSLTWVTDAGERVSVRYASYPWVESAVTATGTLSLVPYSLRVPFIEPGPAPVVTGLAPRIMRRPALPTGAALLASSFLRVEQSVDGKLVRRIELSRGRPVFMEEDTTGDGAIDHHVWYEGGVPVRGERMAAGAGVFNARETWSGGTLATESVDTDGDGKPDFRQVWGKSPLKAWDYNEDGIDDGRERVLPDGDIVRELSSRLNGVFDVAVTWRGEHIVRVTRDGRTLASTADAARGVTWLGPVPALGHVDTTRPDGIQVIGDRSFLVFRFGATVYAEALE